MIDYGEIKKEARVAAEEVLRVCCPDRALPIDSFDIAGRMGLQVKEISVKSNVAGGLVKEKDTPPIIFVNKYDALNRQRFTVAHEIGHYYRHFMDRHEFEYMDYRDQLSSTGTDAEEVYANQFAANLLMPEDMIRSAFETLEFFSADSSRALKMAGIFGVSVDAMSIRLGVFGLVPQ